MFPSPYREILIRSLSAVLINPETRIKSSTLLKAFAIFTTIKENDIDSFTSSYKTIFSQPPACYLQGLHISKSKLSNAYSETIDLFSSLSPIEFFRFIIPDIICNPIKAAKILHESFSDDILLFAYQILKIHTVVYLSSISSEIHKASFDYIWQTYSQKETITEIKLNKADFGELYN